MKTTWSIISKIAFILFILWSQHILLAVVKPSKSEPDRLKAYMTLTVKDYLNDVEIKKSANTQIEKAIKATMKDVYKQRISIELGKKRYYKGDGYIVEIFAKPSKKDPLNLMQLRLKVMKQEGQIVQELLQANLTSIYKKSKNNVGMSYYKLNKSVQKINKDKFGDVNCIIKLASVE